MTLRNNRGRKNVGWGNVLSGSRGLIPVAVLGVACSSLLGIEDVNEGSGGNAGSAGSGGSSTTGGKGGAGVTGGSAGKGAGGATGGATGGGAGTGTGGKAGGNSTGGSGGDEGGSGEGGGGNEPSTGGSAGKGGGAGKGGAAGSGGTSGGAGNGGSGGQVDPTVRGKVVDQRLHPLINIPVMIGDAMAMTDDDGEFQIEDVAATYDAKLTVLLSNYTAGWVYEGLTRRDPTLQVYRGDVQRSGNFLFTPTNPPPDTSKTVIALGSLYGNYQRDSSGAVQSSYSWFGPPTVTATAHGLVWLETNGVPTAYSSYSVSSQQFAFGETGTTNWGLDFAPNTVNTDTISGSVTSPTSNDRTNAVFVQFSSGALIDLVTQTGAAATANYSYLVPTLPNATITVMASEGDSYYGAAAVAHRSGVTSGQTTPALAIPTPPTLVAPAANTTINPNTVFSWNSSASTFVWHAEAVNFYEHVYVVTARKSVTMPTFPNGYSLRAADDAFWRIETHGDATTVDDLAGSNGFADSFAPWGDEPEGPRRDAGTFAISLSRTFWMP